VEALKKRKCHLTTPEHTALTSWLSLTTAQEMCVEATSGGMQSEHPVRYVRRPQVLDPDPANHVPTRTLPCIRGQIIGINQHDHLILKSLLPMVTPNLDISVSQISFWPIISAKHDQSSHSSGTNMLSPRSNACYHFEQCPLLSSISNTLKSDPSPMRMLL
jgi:hypothetical protein